MVRLLAGDRKGTKMAITPADIEQQHSPAEIGQQSRRKLTYFLLQLSSEVDAMLQKDR